MPPLPSYAWRPRWTVLRATDAFPGQDLGRPIPVSQLGKGKQVCEERGFGGMVMWGGMVSLRPQKSPEVLRQAAQTQSTSDLLLRPSNPPDAAAASRYAGLSLRTRAATEPLRVAIVATQDEFDETTIFDMGMVSNTGNGRRYAAQALIRNIVEAKNLELTAVLLYDWKNNESEKESGWVVPTEGPECVALSVRGGKPVVAWRGSMGQLIGAASGELHVDVAVSIQARRSSVELMHHCINARRYVVMGHDYNLPYGPWGMEVDPETIPAHQKELEEERTVMFCTSQHLASFLTRFSNGRVQTRLCYCADYGYFDPPSGTSAGSFPPSVCEAGDCVTLISPCPSKGLPILLRLALMFEHVRFLCVSTGWTKTLHEVQLRAHPNIEVVQGTDDVDSLYRRTALLLMPSLWAESFGLVAVEAQLRGIPVLSTDACGLSEANLLPELRVPDVPLVHDSRARHMLRGTTMRQAEAGLDPLRPGHESTAESVQRPLVQLAHTLIATEAEAEGFASRLRGLVDDPGRTRELGRRARERAIAHVEERRGEFVRMLREVAAWAGRGG